ncbi:MAG: sulfatase [Deltaproteobacteria bacterium]|nr:sulfatase [Deltaproteobacteria bacterium]
MLRRLLDSPRTYFALAALLAVIALASQFRIQGPSRPAGEIGEIAALRERKPNVVFVLIDTLRADRTSAYGYERPTTPVLEVLAERGLRFARVEAQSSWTKTSMASLWTGLLPTHTGMLGFGQALPPEAVLPAEIFREAGYATGGVWRNGWVDSLFGFGQGFDVYLRPSASRAPRRFERRAPGPLVIKGTDEDATGAALEFLASHGHQPFFLYVHYMDVHQYAYDQDSAELGFGTSVSDAYDSAVHWVDRNVGALIARLEERDLSRNTIVVVASDHGEALGERGYEGHARNLYREVTGVPWIVALPFRLPRSVVVEQTVSNLDIWPTLLDLAGLPPLPDTDGRSLVPEIEAAARQEESGPGRPAFAYLERSWGTEGAPSRPTLSVRDGDRRLILSLSESEPQRVVELFDGAADPAELDDLAEARPEWAGELLPGLEATRELRPLWDQVPEVELDELSRDMLRALGYVVK